jgi:hypothetical protein
MHELNIFTSPFASMTRCPVKHRDVGFYIIRLLSPVEVLLLFLTVDFDGVP